MPPVVSPEAMAVYRAHARVRAHRRREAFEARRTQAWAAARTAAARLRDDLGATRVCVFGSLADGRWFHDRSDIDLAVWGIPVHAWLDAVGLLEEVDAEFEFDLVRGEAARPGLLELIRRTGIEV